MHLFCRQKFYCCCSTRFYLRFEKYYPDSMDKTSLAVKYFQLEKFIENLFKFTNLKKEKKCFLSQKLYF